MARPESCRALSPLPCSLRCFMTTVLAVPLIQVPEIISLPTGESEIRAQEGQTLALRHETASERVCCRTRG